MSNLIFMGVPIPLLLVVKRLERIPRNDILDTNKPSIRFIRIVYDTLTARFGV
jgi:hypothetical protein